MGSTVIQLKYSSLTSQPPTLNIAEPAYSNVSGVLWIDDGTGVVPIAGKSYTDRVDAATSAYTANTIVKRDTSGNFSANVITATLYGNANSATILENGRNFSIDGDDVESSTVGFNGSAAVVLQGNLKTTGVSAGTYGGSSEIPVFAVDSKGRLSYAANVSIATSLNISADTGSNTINLATETLTVAGGSGITTVIDPTDTIKIDVDDTVVRSNLAQSLQTIDGDIQISGNLVVLGNTTTVQVDTLVVDDSLIYLGANNYTSDVIDIGFVGNYYDGATQRHAGVFRHAGDKQFYVFDNYDQEPSANTINPADASFRLATLHTNITSNSTNATIATIGTLTLTNALTVPNGGTGATSFTTGAILVGNSTGALQTLANTGTAGTYGENSRTLIVTTDSYGRVSSVTNNAIGIDASQVISGLMAINRGGTNNDTYTTGAAIFYDGSKIATLANTGSAGTYGEASRTLTVTTDAYGRVSSVTNNAIAIDTSQVISGTLGIARGGTGNSTFDIKGVIVSDTASTTGALRSLTSATEGHILQINSSGVPVFAHLNGGTF